jgi:hypothetical protein
LYIFIFKRTANEPQQIVPGEIVTLEILRTHLAPLLQHL